MSASAKGRFTAEGALVAGLLLPRFRANVPVVVGTWAATRPAGRAGFGA